MKSVMEHPFSQVPAVKTQRSVFDRSHGSKRTFNAGYLVPVLVDEALPGDTYSVDMTAFARLATPIFPIMDNIHMDTHFFAVPYRLVWDNFKKFMGEQANPADSTDYLLPEMTSPGGGYANESLHDHLGLPTQVANLTHTSVFHRAYNLIYNTWFRDQNLQNSVVVDKDDGPDNPADYVLLKRGKRHDYFTSCLPWPQKGNSVTMPLGSKAPVRGIGKQTSIWTTGSQQVLESTGSLATYTTFQEIDPVSNDKSFFVNKRTTDSYPDIYADLAQATAATLSQLRQAFAVQQILEKDARGGTRYIELIKAHFGVTSPDYRMQIPEYLGGGTSMVNVNPIAQTSSTDVTSPQGNLAGTMTAGFTGHGFRQSFTEHCIIIGLVSVRADVTYQQGMPRMFSRSTRFDFFWPDLAHIGEQAVLNKEIYADGSGNDELVFGYQERYAEYRYKPSTIHGKFRSNDAQSLDSWHLAQDFASLPLLNSTFIQETPPLDRVIAVPSEPHVLFDSYIKMQCIRPIPMYSVPGLERL